MLEAPIVMIQYCASRLTCLRRKVRFRVTQSTAFRLNVPFIQELGVEFISRWGGRSVVALISSLWHLQ